MVDDNPMDRQLILPPKSAPIDKAGRAVVRGVTGAIPFVGSAIAEAIEYIEPNPEVLDRTRWEGEVTQEVNTLSERVAEINNCVDTLTQMLSQPAAHIAKFMIEHCTDGLMQDWLKVSDINAELSDFTVSDIHEGLGDLEYYGIIQAHRTTGPTEYKLTQIGYQQLDPQFKGWSPQNDARRLAQLTLIQTDGVSADELQKSVGWPSRRFNPAWEILLSYIVGGHISRPSHLGGGAMRCNPSDADRSGLRRFIAAG